MAISNVISFPTYISLQGTLLLLDNGPRFQADRTVTAVEISPDGALIAGSVYSRGVAIWNAQVGSGRLFKRGGRKPDRYLGGATDRAADLAFSPDGSLIAVAGMDATVRLWDPSTGELRDSLAGHGGPVRQVVFSPDGTLLATTSNDLTVRLWNPWSGELIRALNDRITDGSQVVFSRDGSLLATASKNTATLWNPVTGERALVTAGHKGTVRWVAFSPDDSFLATASDDGTAVIWEI